MNPASDFHDRCRRLEALAAHPRSLAGPSNWLNGILLFADYVASVPPAMTRLTAPLRKYPKDFEKVGFTSLDGTRLVGWFGRANAPGERPGLILLPGLFTSKDNNRIRARSVKILRDWGFNILTLDLRGIGESDRVFSTPGIKEVDDIVAAIRWLHANSDARPIHLYAESLAASAALVACGREGAAGRPLVDGRVLSVSPYADPARVLARFSGPVDWRADRDFAAVKTFFRLILRMNGMGHRDFTEYVKAAANHYGARFEDLVSESAPRNWIASCASPTLVWHSRDDSLVEHAQALDLASIASTNPLVHVQRLAWGNHCLYEMADPAWYWAALAAYFGADESAPTSGPARAATAEAADPPR